MPCYISSNENRFYVAAEPSFGAAAAVTESDRLPALKLVAKQQVERIERRDKTGSRSFLGLPSGVRRQTSFELSTYMTSWAPSDAEPSSGPLLVGAMGGAALVYGGGSVSSVSGLQTRFSSAHGLAVGQAVTCNGEIRFVTAIVDTQEVVLNAPWTTGPTSGTPVDRTVTYPLAADLGSVSIYDFWSPNDSVHRILTGAAVDKMRIEVNGDFHEFTFSGLSSDLVDSASFSAGEAGLLEFPGEPPVTELNYSVIPGNLGQAWLGVNPDQFFTLTSAEVVLDNDLDLRNREFGTSTPQCIAAGKRTVYADFNLYEKPDTATKSLYQAARQRSPIPVMFQLGQQATQLCGVYMKSVVPEVPEFLDDENRLEWRFRECRAQGTINDEIYVAFG
ncbi:MAG: hypothetical protein GY953_18150 [bacterium]|nr:hypothetical protein [bacterium]